MQAMGHGLSTARRRASARDGRKPCAPRRPIVTDPGRPGGMTVADRQGMTTRGKRHRLENGSPVPRELVKATQTPDIVSVAERRYRLGRVLHVGPYDQEPAGLARVSQLLREIGPRRGGVGAQAPP
jgi:hypothetical protein